MANPTRTCPDCGKQIEGHPTKIYCSNRCKDAYNTKKRSAEGRDKRAITCKRCGAKSTKDRKSNPDYCEPCARQIAIEDYKRRFTKNWPQCKVYFLTCTHCGRAFSAKRHGKTYCSKACAGDAARQSREPNTCRDCGDQAEPFKTYCKPCRTVRHKNSERAYKQKRRAVTRGVHADYINPRTIYERDNWTCGICGEPVDKRLNYPDYKSATIDHIIPVSKGGTHTHDNVQCAHWDCNVFARDKAEA